MQTLPVKAHHGDRCLGFPAERLVCAQVGNCVLVEINFYVTCCFCSLDLNSQLRIEDEALVDSVSGVIFVRECVSH